MKSFSQQSLVEDSSRLNESSFSPRVKICVLGLVAIPFLLMVIAIAMANLDWGGEVRSLVTSIPGGDKTVHFVCFGGLSIPAFVLFGWKPIRRQCRLQKRSSVIKGIFLMVVLSTFEEFSQVFIETRTFDWFDLASNYLGIAFFSTVAAFITIGSK